MARILLDAICSGNVSLAKDIIRDESYGGVDSQTSRRDGTALFFCCSRGYLDLALLLLSKNANMDARNKCRATPLHAAADNNHLRIVQLLLDRGANINAQTHRGDTALHLAAYRGNADVAQCLVEHGADFLLANESNVTAAVEAMVQGHSEVGQYLNAIKDLHGQPRSLMSLEPSSERMVLLDDPTKGRSQSQPTSPIRHQNDAYPGLPSRGLSYSDTPESLGDVSAFDPIPKPHGHNSHLTDKDERNRRPLAPMQTSKSDQIPHSSHGHRQNIAAPLSSNYPVEFPWRRSSMGDNGDDDHTHPTTKVHTTSTMSTHPHPQSSRNRKNCRSLSATTTNSVDPSTWSFNQLHQRKQNDPSSIRLECGSTVSHLGARNQNYQRSVQDHHIHNSNNGSQNNQLHRHHQLQQQQQQQLHQKQRPLTPVFHHELSLQVSPSSFSGPRSRSPPISLPRQPEENIDESMMIYSPPSPTTANPPAIKQTHNTNKSTLLSDTSSPSATFPKEISNFPPFSTFPKEMELSPNPHNSEKDSDRKVVSAVRSGRTHFHNSAVSNGKDKANSTTRSFNGEIRPVDDVDLLPSLSCLRLPSHQHDHYHHQQQQLQPDHHHHPHDHQPQENNLFPNSNTFHSNPRSPHPSSSTSTSPTFVKTYSYLPSQPQPFAYHRLPSTPSSIASLDLTDSGVPSFEPSSNQASSTNATPTPTSQASSEISHRSNSPMSIEQLPEDSDACARDSSSNGGAFRSMETSAASHTSGVDMGRDRDSVQDLVFISTMSSDEQGHDIGVFPRESHHQNEQRRGWGPRAKQGNGDEGVERMFRSDCNRVSAHNRTTSLLNDLSSTNKAGSGHSLNYLNIPVGST